MTAAGTRAELSAALRDYRRARADRIAAALRGAWSSPERTLDQVRAEFKRRQNRTPEDDA
jgi:hypothetical protein